MGFGVPLAQWLRGPLREWAEALLAERALEADGFFRTSMVRAMWMGFLSGNDRNHYLIWNFLMFQDWRRNWGAGVASGHVTRAPLPPSLQ